ncbi:MAG: MaoC/PaaZ C-terminal domain-containing protein, partial [Anaeromyxobacteraceae bacterium]
MALLARQLYFEAVKVGDELPPLVKPPVDRTQISRYAGASGDFNPLYVDELHAKNAGFPSIQTPGMLGMGFLGEIVVDWLRGARLRRFTSRFVKIVWPGDVLTCRGRVVERRFEGDGVYTVDLELWAENQRGELVVKGLVTAQLYYSGEDDAKQRGGGAPLVVTPAEEEARLAKLSRAQPPKKVEPPRPPPAPPKPAIAPARPAPLRPAAAAPAPKPA